MLEITISVNGKQIDLLKAMKVIRGTTEEDVSLYKIANSRGKTLAHVHHIPINGARALGMLMLEAAIKEAHDA